MAAVTPDLGRSRPLVTFTSMNPWIGWTLALLALFASWQAYGINGIALGVTLIVFWLVLQFNRTIRVMKNAAASPIGHVPSAVMLNAKLKPGMTMLQIVTMTKSLGRKASADGETPERWAWGDAGESTVTVVMDGGGRVASWSLQRTEAPEEPAAS